MNRLPNLKALQAFRYAGEQQSFKAAADRLHVTQAAISQQIRTLEEQLGIKLFKRLTREVVLSPEGRQLLPTVSRAFELLEQGLAALADDPAPDRLNIATLPSFASRWLVPRLGRLRDKAPELSVNLSPSLELASFTGTDLDVAIRFGRGDYPGLTAIKLFDEQLIPVCHPSLLVRGEPMKRQLAGLTLLSDDSPDILPMWEVFQQRSGISFDNGCARLQVNDANLLVEAALAGQGLTLMRFSLAYELLARGQLICPLPLCLKSEFDYYLVAPEPYFKRPKVRLLQEWLQAEFGDTRAAWAQFETHLGRGDVFR
ncbi:LysR family transcriptional regulator [Marinobacterium sp. D7]|uniref:LysR substrate-binding domain-containing protein n=1 Tax=Marinobacterium ramblicola TaxID=2849041 RepID=UPI001C2D9191|nr:LysR substrate-binding domain-containing protein [Marinobacterium ramblicola]MBV1787207.1 LysR family transcriptional regulator [Marinobacterium ramblicola]